jgi:uncharacterized protein (TIGR03000 family)
MSRTSLKVVAFIAVLAVALMAMTGTSQAGWHGGYCGPVGCSPCGWGLCGGPSLSCGWGGWGGCGWGGCGVACGPRLGCHHRSCCVDWCCPVVSCCVTPCVSSCFGGCGVGVVSGVPSAGCGCGGGGDVISAPTMAPSIGTPTPAPTPAPALPVTPPAPGAARPQTGTERNDAGTVTIWVPEDAKVYVNGYLTRSTGNRRQYVSYGLKAGLSYRYEVRAEVVRDGKTIEESHVVTLGAGDRTTVAFKFEANKAQNLASNW